MQLLDPSLERMFRFLLYSLIPRPLEKLTRYQVRRRVDARTGCAVPCLLVHQNGFDSWILADQDFQSALPPLPRSEKSCSYQAPAWILSFRVV